MTGNTNCPKCRGYQLKPAELEPGLVAGICPKCEGVQLPLMNYRFWLTSNASVVKEKNDSEIIEDNEHAIICAKCDHLMTKYRIGNQTANRVDFCASCDEVWLDTGEWALLKKLQLHTVLADMLTEAWQRKIRHEKKAESLKKHYESILGAEDFRKVNDFKRWTDNHLHKDVIKVYLNYPKSTL